MFFNIIEGGSPPFEEICFCSLSCFSFDSMQKGQGSASALPLHLLLLFEKEEEAKLDY